MASVEEILLPDIGDFTDVEIIEILVAPGDWIQAEQSLLTLESDKATIEIPASKGGRVTALRVKVGDRVNRGDPILTLATETATTAQQAAPASAARPGQPPVSTTTPAPPPPAATAAASPAPSPRRPEGETVSVVLPDVGDFAEIPVVEVLVKPGDRIQAEQSILTLESDKATMEIPAPQGGIVQEIAVQVGDSLSAGDLILLLHPDPDSGTNPEIPPSPVATTATDAPRTAPQPASTQPPADSRRAPGEAERRQAPVLPRPEDMAAIAKGRRPHASPTVRRFARELGVDLGRVKGSGRKGRVLKDDVQAFVKQTLTQGATAASGALPLQLPAAPEVDFSRFGPIESRELARIKRISGRHLQRAWLSVPHVTHFDEADITELEDFRKTHNANLGTQGVKLTFLPFLLKAAAHALAHMPLLKASLSSDGEALIFKHYTHIGVAVDTPQGLVVPVVRDVDKKGIQTLAEELAVFSSKARDGKLLPGDMQGGCFTISSLGGIGGTAFTPIVNAPDVAILGVSRSQMKPVWNGDTFVPRLMLPLSLSYDHRVVDGADGARFTSLLGTLLSDIRRLLL